MHSRRWRLRTCGHRPQGTPHQRRTGCTAHRRERSPRVPHEQVSGVRLQGPYADQRESERAERWFELRAIRLKHELAGIGLPVASATVCRITEGDPAGYREGYETRYTRFEGARRP